jgi:hypothetical protein
MRIRAALAARREQSRPAQPTTHESGNIFYFSIDIILSFGFTVNRCKRKLMEAREELWEDTMSKHGIIDMSNTETLRNLESLRSAGFDFRSQYQIDLENALKELDEEFPGIEIEIMRPERPTGRLFRG